MVESKKKLQIIVIPPSPRKFDFFSLCLKQIYSIVQVVQLVEQWGPWQEILGLIPGLHRLFFILKSQKSPRLTPESVQTAKLYEINHKRKCQKIP